MTPAAARKLLPRNAERIERTKAKLEALYDERRCAFVVLASAGDLQQDTADLAKVTPGLVAQQLNRARELATTSSNGTE